MAMGKGYRILHKLPPDDQTPYSVLMDSKAVDDTLMFESGAVVVLSPEESEPLRKQYSKVVDAYGCLGVMCLNTGQESLQYLVLVTSCLSVGKIGESEVFRITGIHFLSLRNDPSDEERIAEIRKLLSSGVFYFTWKATGNPWDLSLCAQRKLQDHDTDNRFFWNRMLHVLFQRYGIDCSKWLLKTMCGGVEMRTIYAGHRQAKACLISRLSCERAGTRFNVRGTNDDGNVANFVETEQVIFLEDQISSFVQTRGSVPLFWEQPGIQVGSHKVHMSRGYEMAAPAFDRHFRTIKQQYGDQVIINLLGQREGEKMLSQAFMNHHSASVHSQDVPYYHFDYHSEIKGSNLKNLEKLKSRIAKHMNQFDFFYTEGDKILHQQSGTIRTNCLDCLDRTNATQTMIGMEMLHRQLEALGLASKPQMIGRFEEVYKQIWVHNGDHISRIYTGTGALGGGRSKYSDASRSATRTIQNNFLDGSKQEAIEILLMGSSLNGFLSDKARALLGTRYLHSSETILRAMTQCYTEYTKKESYRVCVGTYNANGGKHYRSIAYKHQSLADWLLDAYKSHPDELIAGVDYDKPVDIFAVGFEEIVDLNASNIMSASSTNAREWQKEVLKTISREHKYVMLTSIQLVGVVLYIFVRPHLAPRIRDVAVDKVKTGLGGAAGNKGGVAIRFLLNSTSICFICAHLAAGQSQVKERNDDYTEITRRTAFPVRRTILSHDQVFWCGDFNYRIDLGNEEVKSLIASGNLGALRDMDQLNVQRGLGNTFQGFSEGELNFKPTYKYDTFSDDYDTSDKARTPAWTDRILWRVKSWSETDEETMDSRDSSVKLLLYTRAELRTSDHRPVIGLFDIDTVSVDEDRRAQVLKAVVSQQGPPDGTVIVSDATREGLHLSDETVNAVVERLNEIGDIIIVRFVGTDMWILYQYGQYALEALQFDQQEFAGTVVCVRLKTVEWKDEIEKELNLCSSNTGCLYNQFTNSLLGDNFSIPSMDFDMGEDDADDFEVEKTLTSSIAASSSSRSSTPSGHGSPSILLPQAADIPGGPPLAPSPLSSQPSAQTDMVSQESVPQLRASPNPEGRQPPARPSAPPARPSAPPQRPPGGPPKRPSPVPQTTQHSSGPGGPSRSVPSSHVHKMREPLRPAPSDKSKGKKNPRISTIGLPTNVSHQGHAASIEEAEALIQKLMVSPSQAEAPGVLSPQPLHPSKSENNLMEGQSASKSLSHSRTAQDLQESVGKVPSASQQPLPAPRRRSSDNNLLASSESSEPLAPAPAARPRPVPRRDVQSCLVTSDADRSVPPIAQPSNNKPPTPSRQDAAIVPPPVSARPAPPPPTAPRPAPAPPNGNAPLPPVRNNIATTGSEEVHLLDRANSLVDKSPLSWTMDRSQPDPFDTAFARAGPLQCSTITSSNDPFTTTSLQPRANVGSTLSSDLFSPFETPSSTSGQDPFDTSFVSKPVSQSTASNPSVFDDPFDTSKVKYGCPAPFMNPGSTNNGVTQLYNPPKQSDSPLETQSSSQPNEMPQANPPPLPSVGAQPQDLPPAPPPRAPPVPSRVNVPPPVPKRPS